MAAKLNSFRIVLRHRTERLTHDHTLDASSMQDAVRRAQRDAADENGGEPGDWEMQQSENLGAALERCAA